MYLWKLSEITLKVTCSAVETLRKDGTGLSQKKCSIRKSAGPQAGMAIQGALC